MTDPSVSAIYVLWSDSSTRMSSYTWRVWARSTSFYLKPTYKAVGAVKISLHGPDDRHSKPGFKFEIEPSALDSVQNAGGRLLGDPERQWFTGREIEGTSARLLVRLQVTPDLFRPGSPSAPPPTTNLKPGRQGLVIPPPSEGSVSAVEFYLAEDRPFWPNEEKARADNACIGPLGNEAGQFLTGLSVQTPIDLAPKPPVGLSLDHDFGDEDLTRAVGYGVESDVLWVIERLLPQEAFSDPEDSSTPAIRSGGTTPDVSRSSA